MICNGYVGETINVPRKSDAFLLMHWEHAEKNSRGFSPDHCDDLVGEMDRSSPLVRQPLHWASKYMSTE